MISAAPAVLRLVVPGPSATLNATYRVNYRTKAFYKSVAVKEWQDRIHSIAYAEVLRTRWPHRDEPVQVSIWMHGMKADIDACVKAALDAMAGTVYSNDRQVQRLLVERVKCHKGARIEIEVQQWQ